MSRPNIRIGFELEGLVRHGRQATFDQGLCRINNSIDRGTDGSVEGYFTTSARDVFDMWTGNTRRAGNGIEIRTPVLPLDKGLKLFEQILGYLADQSAAGDFKTNKTCGLHVNISEETMVTDGQSFREWYAYLVSMFPEREVLAMFRRTNNDFCRPLFCNESEQEIDAVLRMAHRGLGTSKYHSVAFHGNSWSPECRRIEFRCLGNTNYHLRYAELISTLELIIGAATEAYEHVLENTKELAKQRADSLSLSASIRPLAVAAI